MSVPFYSDESEPIHRKISSSDRLVSDNQINVSTYYEIDRCIEWINHHNFSKVALQFPDTLLKDAAGVAVKLKIHTEKDIFILGDTSYGSCCVDEVAAEHVSADAIIHFGHACLSLTQRLPVLYIFGAIPVDVEDVTCAFKKSFADISTPVIIYYDVSCYHAVGQIVNNLIEYENLVLSKLAVPNEEVRLNDNEVKITKCQRHFIIPKAKKLEDYSIFYIGCQNQTLTNVMLCLTKCKFYFYHPVEKTTQANALNVNQFLRKRYYYIEKTKDAKIIGILAGTLGVSDYQSVMKQLRELIKAAGKKSYTLVVGKINVAKLANFAEIEVFVNVACMESTVVKYDGFYQPIITPYELEIALKSQEWSDDYVTDFTELLPGGARHVPLSEMKHNEADVSLVTGKIRSTEFIETDRMHPLSEGTNESSAVVHRDEMTISSIHSQAAGEFLSHRSWKGLEQCLGETPVAEIQQGKKGIACQYEDEAAE